MVTKFFHLRAIDKGTSIYHRLHGGIDLATQNVHTASADLPSVSVSLASYPFKKIGLSPSLKTKIAPSLLRLSYYFTSLPGFTSFSGVITASFPSKILGGENHTLETIPFSLRGAKLAMKQTCLPTNSSGL